MLRANEVVIVDVTRNSANMICYNCGKMNIAGPNGKNLRLSATSVVATMALKCMTECSPEIEEYDKSRKHIWTKRPSLGKVEGRGRKKIRGDSEDEDSA